MPIAREWERGEGEWKIGGRVCVIGFRGDKRPWIKVGAIDAAALGPFVK